jgi:hypothetical protein
MSIELTDEQARALENGEKPPRVVNPRTKETYFLVQAQLYEKMRQILEVEEIDPSLYEFEEIEESPP